MLVGLSGTDYASLIQSMAPAYGIPPALALAVAQKESGLNPNAVGTSGEIGLFQVMPSTGAQLGYSNLSDPSQNIAAGLTYLQQMYQAQGNWTSALEAYNEGPGAFAANGPYSSSSSYAASILANAGISDSQTPQTTDSTISEDLGLSDLSDDSTGLSSGLNTGVIMAVVAVLGALAWANR